MTINRKEIRQKIAEDLATACPSVQAVYNHMKGGFSGQSPIIRVMSGGSERGRLTTTAGQAAMLFTIQLWVLYSSKTDSWTEENAEDAMDDLEFEVAEWVYANRTNDVWKALDFTNMSRIDVVMFEGNPYMVEDIQVAVKVY